MSQNPTTIVLGDRRIEIAAIPLGGLRKIIGAVHRAALAMQLGQFDESLVDDVILVLSAATKIPVQELEMVETNLLELQEAVSSVMKVSGLEDMLQAKGLQKAGELVSGVYPGLTPSTSSTQP